MLTLRTVAAFQKTRNISSKTINLSLNLVCSKGVFSVFSVCMCMRLGGEKMSMCVSFFDGGADFFLPFL